MNIENFLGVKEIGVGYWRQAVIMYYLFRLQVFSVTSTVTAVETTLLKHIRNLSKLLCAFSFVVYVRTLNSICIAFCIVHEKQHHKLQS